MCFKPFLLIFAIIELNSIFVGISGDKFFFRSVKTMQMVFFKNALFLGWFGGKVREIMENSIYFFKI